MISESCERLSIFEWGLCVPTFDINYSVLRKRWKEFDKGRIFQRKFCSQFSISLASISGRFEAFSWFESIAEIYNERREKRYRSQSNSCEIENLQILHKSNHQNSSHLIFWLQKCTARHSQAWLGWPLFTAKVVCCQNCPLLLNWIWIGIDLIDLIEFYF